ncbi:hypothetical protein GCM10009716_43020 [Streptomyces sodiiphilus]|uniref:Uncharacterized protein n=1 Tax=Streptomyces sodiiphilus TaxID=226217 RepID=A0ABN2PTP6_9ACTN
MSPFPHTRSDIIALTLKRMVAPVCAVLLVLPLASCQVARSAGSGLQVRDAVHQLLSRDAVSVDATLGASPEEVHDYLLRSAARHGGPEPDPAAARLLAGLELTAVVGAPSGSTPMRDVSRTDPLDSALSLGFGGKDAVGVKIIDGRTYLRIGAETLVQDARGGDEAEISAARRFMRRASELPPSLRTASRALQGSWVEVDQRRLTAYARAVERGTGMAPGPATDVAAALRNGLAMLDPQEQWALVDRLGAGLRSGVSVRRAAPEHGADIYLVELTAGHAREALGPLLDLLEQESERFGLPPVVEDPADPGQRVVAELEVRNGLLTHASFDLGQFAGPDGGTLPLELGLTGGTAISLAPPATEGTLVPEDITVALMYLDVLERQRAENPGRANIPGPLQP